MPSRPRHVMKTEAKDSNMVVHETCEVCGVLCVRKCEWETHLRSRKHHKRLASLKKSKLKMQASYTKLHETLTKYETSLGQTEQHNCSDNG